jgi:O-antigen/teichoic acid export membrane protein
VNSYRFKHWILLVTSFLAGQGSVQLINLISGFLLLRWLSVEAYAQYSIAFGFQSTLSILVDLGFSGSIIALVGDRISDKKVIGSYIRSAKHYRNRLFLVALPIAIITFFLVTYKQHWDVITQIFLLSSIISSLFFQGWVAYYSAPLLIHKQLKKYYEPQIIAALCRLVILYVLYILSVLVSWSSAWVNSFILAFNGFYYNRSAQNLVLEPKVSDPKINREMLSYIAPVIPVIFFTALQGQVLVFIIALFGETKSIAEVGALGRLGQIFMIFSASNSVIIAPYIAKIPLQSLVKKYLQILAAAIGISIILSMIGFIFPNFFLFILGSKYQDLQLELSFSILVASINYTTGVISSMNSARRWIFWWGNLLEITVILSIQITCILLMNLDTTIQAIYFSLITTISYSFVHCIIGIYGLLKSCKYKLT